MNDRRDAEAQRTAHLRLCGQAVRNVKIRDLSLLIHDIKSLVGVHAPEKALRGAQLAVLPSIENAYLLIEGDRIAAFGPMSELTDQKERITHNTERITAKGRIVMPAWVDSHTHIVFAGSREGEMVDKIKGLSYAEIAARGGGILNSAARLAAASEDKLFNAAWARLEEVMRMGTGSIEIKSGYGLTVEGELKMLRVIKKLKARSPLGIRSTFLGAHTYPVAFRDDHEGYIRQIIDEMLPVITEEGLADYIDVFCEKGFFTPEETERICRAGMSFGLRPRIHANQLNASGGTQVGVKLGALSVDHLETMDEDAIASLAGSDTIGTLLPNAAFFLRMPFQPARQLINAGCAIALATDYNPGSAPSGNMNLVVSMACIQMKMLPEEAINAATINGAYALEWGADRGSIAVGKRADLLITRPVPSLAWIPYAFGHPSIETVILSGQTRFSEAENH